MKMTARWFYWGLLLIEGGGLLVSSRGVSSELDSAQADLEKAQRDYYQAIHGLSNSNQANSSQDPFNELKKKILTPAEDRVDQARQKEILQQFEKARTEGIAQDKIKLRLKAEDKASPTGIQLKELKNIPGAKPSGFPTGSPQPMQIAPVPRSVSPPSGVSRPDVILDGNGIPKEIEFQKSQK